MRTITVKVTQEIIDEAKRLLALGDTSRSCCCPAALAIHDAGFPMARVTAVTWRPYGTLTLFIPLPIDLARFVNSFDVHGDAAPATFELEAPEPEPGRDGGAERGSL